MHHGKRDFEQNRDEGEKLNRLVRKVVDANFQENVGTEVIITISISSCLSNADVENHQRPPHTECSAK